MAQLVKALDIKSDHQSLIPERHMGKGKNRLPEVVS